VDGTVVGVLSDRDIAMRAQSQNPVELTGQEVMTTIFYSVDANDPIEN
jgi:hypothetical protein